jgi:hypothetical protein
MIMFRIAAALSLMLALSWILTIPVSAQCADIVGDISNASLNRTALAKGNSYDITVPVVLDRADFWLQFTTTQTLTFYVYDCPTEFGTYTQIWSSSNLVTGTGAAWYSSGPIGLPLNPGTHYIIAVSWDGTLDYFYGTGDSWPTTFGAETHAYAVGTDPLPATFSSGTNDTAVYHQRLWVSGGITPVWETNSPEASLTINGADVPNPCGPVGATTKVMTGTFATMSVGSTLVGNGHDILVGFQPVVPAGGGGFPIGGSQIINIDLTDPAIFFVYGGGLLPTLVPFPGSFSLPIAFTVPILIAAQSLVIDPAHPSGFSLSQASQHETVICGTQENFDTLTVGNFYPLAWSNGGGTAEWLVHSGSTASGNTGPVTGAFSPPNYMYCETSSPNSSANFVMDTCTMDVSLLSSFTLNFRLSRLGTSIGTLDIYLDDGSGTFPILLTSYTGAEPTGADWTAESIPFTPTASLTAAFRFSYTGGGGYTGDLAIDDFDLQ